MLSTITSPVFSRITVHYKKDNFRGVGSWREDRPLFRELSQAERAEEVSRHRTIFKVFREAHRVRDFRLELHVTIWGCIGEEPVRILEEAIAEERAENGFNDFLCDPFVDYNPQRSRLSP